MVVRNSELRKKIDNKDKMGIYNDFTKLIKAIDPQLPLGEYFDIGRFVRELRDYVLEEVE